MIFSFHLLCIDYKTEKRRKHREHRLSVKSFIYTFSTLLNKKTAREREATSGEIDQICCQKEARGRERREKKDSPALPVPENGR